MGNPAVSWFSVHEYVAPILERVGSWPQVGSVDWCALPDDHPAKVAAIFDAAQHHALRVETAQEAKAQASQAISGAADWSAIAAETLSRASSARIRREVA
jgi:hypothetical protein